MKAYIIAVEVDNESRNRSPEQEVFLETNNIHFKWVYDNYGETAVIFQLPHAILFRDFVRKEMGEDSNWQIMEIDLTIVDDPDNPETSYYFNSRLATLVPQEQLTFG